MKSKYSVAESLYIIGTINALTGYYSLNYKNNEEELIKKGATELAINSAENRVVLNSGITIKGSINIWPLSYVNVISTEYHSNPGLVSEYYTGSSVVPFVKEVNKIEITAKTPKGEVTEINIEKHYDEDNYNKVLSKDATYAEKERFLIESLDKKNRKRFGFKFPSNNRINMTEDQKKEIELTAIGMTRWLESQVRQEKEVKKLIKE